MRNQRKQNCYNGALQRPTELYEELRISLKEKKKSRSKSPTKSQSKVQIVNQEFGPLKGKGFLTSIEETFRIVTIIVTTNIGTFKFYYHCCLGFTFENPLKMNLF